MGRQLPFVIAGFTLVAYALFLIFNPVSFLNSFLGPRKMYLKPYWPKWLVPNPDYERLSARVFGLIFLLWAVSWECFAFGEWSGIRKLALYSTAFTYAAGAVFWVVLVLAVPFEGLRLFRPTREGLWRPACQRLGRAEWQRMETVLFAGLACIAIVLTATLTAIFK